MSTDKIYLVGFMGSGKSTVARALADRLGWAHEDLDRWVEHRERRTIADLFATEGEAYFRQVEREVLQELTPHRHVVVATGGGTFVDPFNCRAINSDGTSVWLDVSFDTVVRRLPSDGRRPLAADREAMHALWESRRAAYALAHLRVDTAAAPVCDVVERIVDWIGG